MSYYDKIIIDKVSNGWVVHYRTPVPESRVFNTLRELLEFIEVYVG